LQQLFREARVNGRQITGESHYDLSKIKIPNDGTVNLDLLAPGLD
jgi:hypothetical protein